MTTPLFGVITYPGSDSHVVVAVTVLKQNEVIDEEDDVNQDPGSLERN